MLQKQTSGLSAFVGPEWVKTRAVLQGPLLRMRTLSSLGSYQPNTVYVRSTLDAITYLSCTTPC